MHRTCRTTGCTAQTATQFGAYCRNHKARLRRHGSTAQQGITKGDLGPYLAIVAARRAKNEGSPLWGHLEARWDRVRDHASTIETTGTAGSPIQAHEAKAAYAVSRIGVEGLNREVIDTALAMFVMRALEPRRFRDDRGFTTQLVRRVRGVGDMNVGAAWDHKAGKVRRVYRETPPRVAEILGAWITGALGAAGMRLAALEERDLDARKQEFHALYQAIEDLR